MDTLYTKIDLAEQLNLSVATINNHMKEGTLTFLKIGKAVRFREEDVNNWIKRYYPRKYISQNTSTEQVNNFKKVLGEI
jgi:excisionase family DNA binding protein|tara:strand:+ start:676 stop:912 length:237 start_codon:yes stop_codon:yes gene_type:complete